MHCASEYNYSASMALAELANMLASGMISQQDYNIQRLIIKPIK